MSPLNSKIYFVREIGFCYNDECYGAEEGFGCVQSTFNNLEEATQSLKEHTRNAFQGMKIFEFDPLGYVSDKEELKKINDFLVKEFNKGFIQPSTNPTHLNISYAYKLPDSLSVEQAWELRTLTQIEQFEIIEGTKNEPSFWGFKLGEWSPKAGEWRSREASRWNETKTKRIYKNIPLFYNSSEAAHNEFWDHLEMTVDDLICEEIYIKGSYEELSDTPEILKSFIENENEMRYDTSTQQVHGLLDIGEKILIFNSLLKTKIVELVPFPTEEIIALGTDWDLDYS